MNSLHFVHKHAALAHMIEDRGKEIAHFLSVSTVTSPPPLLLWHMHDAAAACANRRVATEWYFTASVFVAGYFDPGWSLLKDF